MCVHVLYAAAIELEDTRKQLNLKKQKVEWIKQHDTTSTSGDVLSLSSSMENSMWCTNDCLKKDGHDNSDDADSHLGMKRTTDKQSHLKYVGNHRSRYFSLFIQLKGLCVCFFVFVFKICYVF